MTFKPAPVDNGYTFVRADLEGRPVVEADANLVCSTSRGTTLEKRGVKVFTTEHTLAAVSGCDIDNIIIEMDGPEPPIMDGSSKYFIEALESAGIVEQEADRNVYVVKDVISYSDPATGSEITGHPGRRIPGDHYGRLRNESTGHAECRDKEHFGIQIRNRFVPHVLLFARTGTTDKQRPDKGRGSD